MNEYEIHLVDLDDSVISVIVEHMTLGAAIEQAKKMAEGREKNICRLRTVVITLMDKQP
ncbi:hypothetical protein [Pseudomonas moorei]|uniref:hypothetical protein n=1 Tax=Pseudomonas moorei TaxID=395599 RepID=UPI0036F1D720